MKRLSWIELRSALMLAVMTAIGLPLMPDRAIDPWGGFNPWEVWFFTVLTAAISYLGYIAVKVLGSAKGLLVSGLAGALVSSTAVTVAFARTAKAGGNPRPLSGAAALAAMVSVLRVMTVVLVIQPQIIRTVGPAALAAAAAFALSGLVLIARSTDKDNSEVSAKNPFELVPLLIFAALFALVSTASAALVGMLGSGSLVVTSALSGAFDVDVAVLTALRMVGQAVSPEIVGQGVLAALAANAIGRLGLAISAGPDRLLDAAGRRDRAGRRLRVCGVCSRAAALSRALWTRWSPSGGLLGFGVRPGKVGAMEPSRDISRLLEIMAALRTPVTGCPWDLEQNFETIAPYTLEEAYEVADAISRGDLVDLRDELGDLLLQVVFHAQMAQGARRVRFRRCRRGHHHEDDQAASACVRR